MYCSTVYLCLSFFGQSIIYFNYILLKPITNLRTVKSLLKVCYVKCLLAVYPPDTNYDICKAYDDKGYRVFVLTCFSNEPTKIGSPILNKIINRSS